VRNYQNRQLIGLRLVNPDAFRDYMGKVFAACAGNLKRSARELKVSRTTLQRWMAADPQLVALLEKSRQ